MSFKSLREEIDLSGEAGEMVHIEERVLKQRIAKRYNSVVILCKFEEGDLVLSCANIGPLAPGQGKHIANWEGPY